MKLTKLVVLLALVLSFSTQAKVKDREKNIFIGQKIVHLFDNATVGAIQSIIGATHIVWYMIFDNGPEYRIHNNPQSEVIQMGIENAPPFFNGAYSLGLFQVGGYARDHEGGHSVASAALGPLYLPTVGASYLIEGHRGSFVEDWAELEGSEDAGYEWLKGLEVGPAQIKIKDKKYNVVAFKFSLNQEQQMGNRGLEIKKAYKWLNTNIVIPLANSNKDINQIPILEIDVLKKEMNLVVDNVNLYLVGDQEIKWQIKTEQEYLSYDRNDLLGIIHKKAFSWQASYGLIYNLGKKLKVETNLGVGISYDSLEFSQQQHTVKGFSFGTKYELKMTVYEKLDYTYTRSFWKLDDNSSYTSSFSGVTYEKKRPFKFLTENSRLKLNIGSFKKSYKSSSFNYKQNTVGIGFELTF